MAKGTRIIKSIGIALNIFVAAMLLISAYAGCINPSSLAISATINMSFPIWISIALIVLIIDILTCRKMAFIPLSAFILSAGPLYNYSPFNISTKQLSRSEKFHSFKLLTYNVLNFKNRKGNYPNDTNPTISYILSTDADIVCLQECEYFQPLEQFGVAATQIDSLRQRYPHRWIGTSGQSILSKVPITPINLGIDDDDKRDIAAYLVEANNRILTVYNVHLRSFGFTGEDKQFYNDLTTFSGKEEFSQVKPKLISKLNAAARHRARQARLLKAHIDKTGGNIIVCGDFNDTPNCYAIRTISGDCMHDAYVENAFGPTITYNADRFYFRIDHVLYKGALEAVNIERGSQDYSDHYPLLTTFLWQEN